MNTRTALLNPETPPAYEPISIGHTESDITATMNSFMEFLQLPYEERVKVVFVDESRPRTGVSGYQHKGHASPDGSRQQDNKHIFHMTQTLHETYGSHTRRLPHEARVFLRAAYSIHSALSAAAKRKYQELEGDIPGITNILFPPNGKNSNHTRFLAYQDAKRGMLASPHYDKGTGTIAVAESHGGLRVGYGPEDLKLLERSRFEPIFFPNYGYHQLAEMLGVDPTTRRAAWHDVIDTGDRVSEEVTRWSLIHFIDPAHIYLENTKEQTHTPIPWRGLGKLALRSDSQSFLAA